MTTQLYALDKIASGDESRNWKRIAELAFEAVARHIRNLRTLKC